MPTQVAINGFDRTGRAMFRAAHEQGEGSSLTIEHAHAWMLRAAAYRRHIENRIRAGNTALP
jgi:glyceraldehyde-3-phosphate dehydrogenase/erythrose-4-phosphate dehydrogenase